MGYNKFDKGKTMNIAPTETIHDVMKYPVRAIKERGIDEATATLYGIRTKISSEDGVTPVAYYFPYYDITNKRIVGYKKRDLLKSKKESFSAIGDVTIKQPLFGSHTLLGKDKFKLIICEGEFDSACLYRALKKDQQIQGKDEYAIHVVSIGMGTANAVEHIMNNIELLEGYKEVVLVFDNDKATPEEKAKGIVLGQDAVEDVALALTDISVKYVKLPLKDPCDMFQAMRSKELVNSVKWGAFEYKPETLASFDGSEEELDDLMVGLPVGLKIKSLPELSACMHGIRLHEMTVLLAPSGCGKALANDTKLPTPNGWQYVEDIAVGDYLFDSEGKPTKVLNIFPQGIVENYSVNFDDSTSIICCENHLWNVRANYERKRGMGFSTKSVKELLDYQLITRDTSYVFEIPLASPVEYEAKPLRIPAYDLGFLIGDGSLLERITASVAFEDVDFYMSKLITECRRAKDTKVARIYFPSTVNDAEPTLREKLEYYGLSFKKSQDKFIPSDYLQGSVEQRMELLAGLLDTDGTISFSANSKSASFSTTSKQLAEDVQELVRSLGGKSNISLDKRVDKYHSGYCARVTVRVNFNPFQLPRKKERFASRNYINEVSKKIISIKPYGKKESTCFIVDNKDHLFLAGDFHVTHNSTISKQIAFELCKEHGLKAANFFLEEPLRLAKQSYVALYNNVRPVKFFQNPDILSRQQVEEARNWMKDTMIFYDCDKASILKPESVVRMVKHVAIMGYQFIAFDHLSFVISGDESGNERKVVDKLLTDLSLVARAYPIHIFVVSHIKRNDKYQKPKNEDGDYQYPHWMPVRKEDGRSSGAIEQLAHNIICMEPEILDEEGMKGNVRLVVRKNRQYGEERVCDILSYNTTNGRLV